jgi:hypothetical protein
VLACLVSRMGVGNCARTCLVLDVYYLRCEKGQREEKTMSKNVMRAVMECDMLRMRSES